MNMFYVKLRWPFPMFYGNLTDLVCSRHVLQFKCFFLISFLLLLWNMDFKSVRLNIIFWNILLRARGSDISLPPWNISFHYKEYNDHQSPRPTFNRTDLSWGALQFQSLCYMLGNISYTRICIHNKGYFNVMTK